MAFPQRSAAPSWLPVHLHNVAACHMEAGSTNLCPAAVLRVPLWPLLPLLALPRVRLFPSFLVISYFLGCFRWQMLDFICAKREEIITVGNKGGR